MTLDFSLWAAATRTTFEWGRIQSNSDWILPVAVLLAGLLFVRWLYRRDAVELPPAVGWLLTALRTITLIGLFLLWLQPQWRVEEEKTIPSRAIVLVDGSLSMGLTDADNGSAATASRIDQVAAALEQSNFLNRLRHTHEVVLGVFDEELHRDRLLLLPKLNGEPTRPDGAAAPGPTNAARAAELPGRVEAANANKAGADAEATHGANGGGTTETAAAAAAGQPIPWSSLLRLSGDETRLGQALGQMIAENANAPVAGIFVLSDGGQNAGPAPETAATAAKDAEIPVFTVGVGSDQQPPSVRLAAFTPPPRVYPGDPYSVSGVIQAWRMPGKTVSVRLLSRPAAAGAADRAARGTGEVIAAQDVVLRGDGEETPVRFDVTAAQVGRRTLTMIVDAPESDRQRDDNLLEADVEVVDRKNRVLLFAGGPTREYQFLRNQLYRDKSVASDVLLQTAQPGVSQEAQQILDAFPSTREQMYQYDCVVAFDPDWRKLTPAQVDLLEGWVAEQGGGLIVLAGPVYAGQELDGWTQGAAPMLDRIRGLYPVEFPRQVARVSSRYEAEQSWPLDLTRDGLDADFMQLADSPADNRAAWQKFPGVFGYLPLRGPKPAATVLARFSDPQAGGFGGAQPVFMAWQFYGSGRVLYIGSGEFWRLRAEDPRYFERLYTQLIRHVSKGRLLRGSNRGMLLVGQERYRLGNSVGVQAYRLTNAQLEPLVLPSVELQIIEPDQAVRTIALRPDPGREGSYQGQFSVLQEGEYRLELALPEGGDEDRLTQRIMVEIPNLEREHPQRDDAVLSRLAATTGGRYHVGLQALSDPTIALAEQLKDRTKTTILTAAMSKEWEEQWLWWAMLALLTLLSVEWLTRRLSRLA